MQRRKRLESAERAGSAAVQETWPAEAGNHKDGAGGDGLFE